MSILNTFLDVKSIVVKVRTFAAKGSKGAPMFFTCEFTVNRDIVDKTAIIRVGSHRFDQSGLPCYSYPIYKHVYTQIYNYCVINKYIPNCELKQDMYNLYDPNEVKKCFYDKKIFYDDLFIKVRNKQDL